MKKKMFNKEEGNTRVKSETSLLGWELPITLGTRFDIWHSQVYHRYQRKD